MQSQSPVRLFSVVLGVSSSLEASLDFDAAGLVEDDVGDLCGGGRSGSGRSPLLVFNICPGHHFDVHQAKHQLSHSFGRTTSNFLRFRRYFH